MLTASQLRAARALLGISQKDLAEAARLSLPTIQRMERSREIIRGQIDSLMRVVETLDMLGVEIIAEGTPSPADGRGVRLKATTD